MPLVTDLADMDPTLGAAGSCHPPPMPLVTDLVDMDPTLGATAGEMSAGELALTIGVHGLYSLILVYYLPQLLY